MPVAAGPLNLGSPQQQQSSGINFPQQMIQQFNSFRRSFSGGEQAAKQQVMQMIQNGSRSNAQLQQAINMAQQFTKFLG